MNWKKGPLAKQLKFIEDSGLIKSGIFGELKCDHILCIVNAKNRAIFYYYNNPKVWR